MCRLFLLTFFQAFSLSLFGQLSPTSGIQERIDKIKNKGGTVELPAGKYYLIQSITVPPNVTLKGVPGKTVLVKKQSPVTVLRADVKSGDKSIRVKSSLGFQLGMELALAKQNKGYMANDMDAWAFDWDHPRITRIQGSTLHLDRPIYANFKMKETFVLNFFPAIYINRSANVEVNSISIDGQLSKQPGPYSEFQTSAISSLLSKNIKILNCKVSNWPSDGISIQGGNDVEVANCLVENSRGHGFHPGSKVISCNFRNNTAVNNKWDGLYFCQAVKDSIIENNTFSTNGRHGIGGLGGGNDPKTRDMNNTLRNNNISLNARAGIEVKVSSGHVIIGNTIINNSISKPGYWPGISIHDATEIKVSKNTITDEREENLKTQGYGIQIKGKSDKLEITQNKISGNSKAEISKP